MVAKTLSENKVYHNYSAYTVALKQKQTYVHGFIFSLNRKDAVTQACTEEVCLFPFSIG